MDESNVNAQNSNAKAMLANWHSPGVDIVTLAYGAPDRTVAANPSVRIVRLWRRHGWMAHLYLRYLKNYDLVFYPGVHFADAAGLKTRKLLGMNAPIVATLEGLLGDSAREQQYSRWAGHPVYCQRVSGRAIARVDGIIRRASHIIAISPFLANMCRHLYGKPCSILPLGIDDSMFFPASTRMSNSRPMVVCAASLSPGKRPHVFIDLAKANPDADFQWYGGGEMREALNIAAADEGVRNVAFVGPLPPAGLAEAFRKADIFVLPSRAEGVPKVSQEAAACGLPVVLNGFYEAPSVIDGRNGYVVWSDDELFDRVARLIMSPGLCAQMGSQGVAMSREWSWKKVAPRWGAEISAIVANGLRPAQA